MGTMGCYAGIDIGGSHIGGVLIDEKLRMVKAESIGIIGKRNRKVFLEELDRLLDELCGSGVRSIGAGVPGPVKDGKMFWSCNSQFLENTDFREILRRKSRKVTVDNDVDCMAFGEACTRKEKNILAVTLGTGVGGGIVIDGRLHNSRPYAGEVGHMSIDPSGVKCTCGSRGCWQEYVGVRGVQRLAVKHLGKVMEPDELYVLAKKGDGKAKAAWEDYGRLVGLGLANLCNILDPEVIVIGGGISGAFGMFEKPMKKEMGARLKMKLPLMVQGKEHAVAFGAACMAMKA
jgi:glucokinase